MKRNRREGGFGRIAWSLLLGFCLGGLLTKLCEIFLADSPARDFLTTSLSASLGPASFDLYAMSLTLGPVTFLLNILTVVGVMIVWLAVRSWL